LKPCGETNRNAPESARTRGETRTITLVEQNDADLVKQTLCGNTSAYNGLVQRYQRQVYNLAYRMLGNAEDAGDLVQDTFLRAYGALTSFRQDASFLTWLYKIASNLCIDQLRSRKAKSTLSLEVELEEGREPAADLRSTGPEEAAVRGSVQDVVQRAILNLPEKYRAVVVMRHLNDMSVDEIARVLELPTGTVKTHLFRAREMLRGRLRPVLEMETDGK
jgi:RNA polymerase sigma-70 factor (ECF subfamily)